MLLNNQQKNNVSDVILGPRVRLLEAQGMDRGIRQHVETFLNPATDFPVSADEARRIANAESAEMQAFVKAAVKSIQAKIVLAAGKGQYGTTIIFWDLHDECALRDPSTDELIRKPENTDRNACYGKVQDALHQSGFEVTGLCVARLGEFRFDVYFTEKRSVPMDLYLVYVGHLQNIGIL